MKSESVSRTNGSKKPKGAYIFLVVFAILGIAFVTTACGQNTVAEPTADINAIQTQAFQTAMASIATQTQPAPPTAVPTEAPPSDSPTNHFGWNFLGNQESGGITIEIARIVLADKSSIPVQDFTLVPTFDDKPVVAEIIFRVTNNTQQVVSVYPDQGTVVAGSEQIQLTDYFLATFGDDLGGEIYPGVTKVGGIWLGFKRTPVTEIQQMTIVISAPHDANLNSLGSDFNFVLDLSNRQDQPLPDELK